MEQKFYMLAFALALLRTSLDFFYGEKDKVGAFGSQEWNPLNFILLVKFTMGPPLSMWVLSNYFPCDFARTHFSLTTRS